MDYLEKLVSSLNNQIGLIPKHLNDEMLLRKDELIKENINNIDNHTGSDSLNLKNTNSLFKGTYKPLTTQLAREGNSLTSKNTGDEYNFVWTGAFVEGFEMRTDGFDYVLFSTGTGSGAKKAFFDGYKNLFGIQKTERENLYNEVGYDIITKILTKTYK